MNINLMKGDCLELMKDIPDGSVDLVLTDPPYAVSWGNKNRNFADLSQKEDSKSWDKMLPTNQMFQEITRVLRQNGKCILFSQEPYTSHLVTNQIRNLPFSYRAIWYKNTKGNHLMAKTAMLNLFEDICVFQKRYDADISKQHPLRNYFAEEKAKSGLSTSDFNRLLGNKMASHYFTNGIQFLVPTEIDYKKLQATGFFQKPYEEVDEIARKHKESQKSVFNLWRGGKSKSNVLEYAKDNDGYHPTQKPVKLLEDLIQTYSNEGNTVLDFTMGSGSTGVACINTNRNFIGIELDKGYFNIAKQRIEEAKGGAKE